MTVHPLSTEWNQVTGSVMRSERVMRPTLVRALMRYLHLKLQRCQHLTHCHRFLMRLDKVKLPIDFDERVGVAKRRLTTGEKEDNEPDSAGRMAQSHSVLPARRDRDGQLVLS